MRAERTQRLHIRGAHIGAHSGSNLFNHSFIGGKQSAFVWMETFFQRFFPVSASALVICLSFSSLFVPFSVEPACARASALTMLLGIKLFLATDMPNGNCVCVCVCWEYVFCTTYNILSFRRFWVNCRHIAHASQPGDSEQAIHSVRGQKTRPQIRVLLVSIYFECCTDYNKHRIVSKARRQFTSTIETHAGKFKCK